MKRFLGIAIFALVTSICIGPAHPDVPQKPPLNRYTGLWTNSPFTSKPPPATVGPTINPFDDFILTGIAPVPGGHRITIVSKKNAEIKKVIEPGNSGEFKVISVNRNPEKALGTTVVLASGGIQGTVRFEPELITLKAAPAAPQQPQQVQNLPPGATPPQPAPDNSQRQPRPRIVPPPVPQNTQNTNQGRSDSNSSRTRDSRRR